MKITINNLNNVIVDATTDEVIAIMRQIAKDTKSVNGGSVSMENLKDCYGTAIHAAIGALSENERKPYDWGMIMLVGDLLSDYNNGNTLHRHIFQYTSANVFDEFYVGRCAHITNLLKPRIVIASNIAAIKANMKDMDGWELRKSRIATPIDIVAMLDFAASPGYNAPVSYCEPLADSVRKPLQTRYSELGDTQLNIFDIIILDNGEIYTVEIKG